MNKKLCLASLLFCGYFTAQEITVFSEDFNDLEKELEWEVLDRDRDGKTWSGAIGSDDTAAAGWDNENGGLMTVTSFNLDFGANMGPLDSDDVLISPVIELPNSAGDITLSYKIGVSTDYLNGVQMNNMSYQLFVLEDGEPWYPTLIPLDEKKFSDSNSAETKNINLNQFKGKKVKLYWRHYDSFGQFSLLLDDVLIKTKIDTTEPTIFPNPVQDKLFIGGIENMAHYKVYNMAGRLITEGNYLHENGIDVSNLEKEIYIIAIEGNHKKSLKFIKQ